jgi:hypothetical protein
MNFLESLKSKRTIVAIVASAPVAFKIWQHIQAGEPVPAELFYTFGGIWSVWMGSDAYRPTAPRNEVVK